MNILALDCAQKTGWASYFHNKIESGMQDFSKKPGESNGMIFHRFNRFLLEMNILACSPLLIQSSDFLNVKFIDYIIYEKPFWRGSGSSIEIGLVTRIEEFCDLRRIDYSYVATSTIKKFAIGSGRANKKELMNKFEQEVGRPPIDDNESDAYFILKYGMEEVGIGLKKLKEIRC